jgi:hypothetical protein
MSAVDENGDPQLRGVAAGAPPTPPALDADVYCLGCGYNLRGLSGDPVRCPECAYLNPVGDVEIPAETVRRQLRNMETAPAVCVLALLVGVPVVLLGALSMIPFAVPGGSHSYATCGGIAPIICLGVWITSCVRFARYCLHKPGWFDRLLAYHFWALLLAVVIVGAIAGPCGLLWYLLGRWSYRYAVIPAIMLAGGVPIILLIPRVAKPLHRRLMGTIEPLQREVAVTLIRDLMRRRLAASRSV